MMRLSERLGLLALHRLDPERAHDLAIALLAAGLAPGHQAPDSARLHTEIGGLSLPHPVGLAAGLDKNARAVDGLLASGFAFVEVGAATPRPQPGNARPRLFRLHRERAIINRFGFNNDGVDAIADRLAKRKRAGVVGINLGANKDSPDRAEDFAQVLATAGPHVDFATINVSSPNTEKLRELQGRDALAGVLDRVNDANQALDRPVPVFLKVAPDLTEDEIDVIADVALAARLSAVLATNTTLSRDGIASRHANEAGGLSGPPLFDRSTAVLAAFHQRLGRDIPLIGIGGISNGADAYAKIRAGASAVQLYSALIYQGLGLGVRIARELDQMLERDGFDTVKAAIGTA